MLTLFWIIYIWTARKSCKKIMVYNFKIIWEIFLNNQELNRIKLVRKTTLDLDEKEAIILLQPRRLDSERKKIRERRIERGGVSCLECSFFYLVFKKLIWFFFLNILPKKLYVFLINESTWTGWRCDLINVLWLMIMIAISVNWWS